VGVPFQFNVFVHAVILPVFDIAHLPFRVVVDANAREAGTNPIGLFKAVHFMDPKHRLFFQRCPLSLDMALVARVPEPHGLLPVPNLFLKA